MAVILDFKMVLEPLVGFRDNAAIADRETGTAQVNLGIILFVLESWEGEVRTSILPSATRPVKCVFKSKEDAVKVLMTISKLHTN